jgi:hypothetical protein
MDLFKNALGLGLSVYTGLASQNEGNETASLQIGRG